ADRERLVLTYAAGSLLLAHQRLPLLSAACPGKLRVGANSPSLWPTMSSLTDTGMNFCPLYTLNVRPTNCGRIVERRDQVLIGARPPFSCASSAFFSRCRSTNGPFQTERAIIAYLFFFAWRERMIILSVCLLLRVRAPLVGLPHGVTGWRPPEVRPSPPPCGWSTGFLATPRVSGFTPIQRLRPALAKFWFWLSGFDTEPTVPMQSARR